MPNTFNPSPDAELVVRFTDKTLGVLESALKLKEIPEGRLSGNTMLGIARDLEKEDPAAALKAYTDAVETYPEDANLLNSAAWALVTSDVQQVHDPKRAILWARKAVQLTKEEDGNILDTLAVALHEDGQLEEAARLQQRAAKLSPSQEIVQRAKTYAEELQNRK